jgi:hypothetical protein
VALNTINPNSKRKEKKTNKIGKALETGRKENVFSESKYTKNTSKELSSKNDPTIASLCPLIEYTTRFLKC